MDSSTPAPTHSPNVQQAPGDRPWFLSPRSALALGSIFLVSLLIRFWGLERFNTFVFDEVYYAKFANNYLTKTEFFNAHPPLSQYLIAIGIAIGQKLPFGAGVMNDLAGSMVKTWSYRWLNALTGAFIPLVVAGFAYQLTLRSRFAILAALLAALDGLFLVESRYALNNIYLVLFGLLGQVCFFYAARNLRSSWGWLILAGLFLGCSASIKWNGLWFLISIAGFYVASWGLRWMRSGTAPTATDGSSDQPILSARAEQSGEEAEAQGELEAADLAMQITRLPIAGLIGGLLAVPCLTYYVLWIPHIQQNPQFQFWRLQWEIYNYHRGTTVIGDVHPYCSNWLTWLIMLIPVAYFYKVGINPYEFLPLNATNTPLPSAAIFAVHAMGNPPLWWMSTGAIALLLVGLVWRLKSALSKRTVSAETSALMMMAIGYGGNLLPWVRISRCAFLYHYMGASIFATMALAYFCDRMLARPKLRGVGIWVLFLAAIGFVWWMPVFLGLPLDQSGYQSRMWLSSWIEGVNAFKPKLTP